MRANSASVDGEDDDDSLLNDANAHTVQSIAFNCKVIADAEHPNILLFFFFRNYFYQKMRKYFTFML